MRKSKINPHAENKITELRLEKKLSQAQLGEKIGTSAAQINRLENGKIQLTIFWMEKIAKALSVQPSDLVSGWGVDQKNTTEGAAKLIVDFAMKQAVSGSKTSTERIEIIRQAAEAMIEMQIKSGSLFSSSECVEFIRKSLKEKA